MIRLSSDCMESFCGDVLPLRLLGVEEFGMAPIEWTLEGDCVHVRRFTEKAKNVYDDGNFTDGVLITFLVSGRACVIASFEGKEYRCEIVSRERKTVSSEEACCFLTGDFHIHTTSACSKPDAKRIVTTRSDGSSPKKLADEIRREGQLDVHVISDHADLLNRKEFFRGYLEAEQASDSDPIIFPGGECDIFSMERDRFGIYHNNANEVVCLNASTYMTAQSYQEFLDGYADCPYMICNLAHPNLVTLRTVGKGDFFLQKNNTPRFRQMVKYLEIGNGTDREGNLVNEYLYSVALDHGFRVSTTCSSDSHGDYKGFPGRTIIMAKDRTKESIFDALWNQRAYACCSGNLKLRYSVNGVFAPATLPLTNKYRFHVEISYFREDPSTVPVHVQVISNGGVSVREIEGVDFSSFDFEIESEKASYFFLRLWDEEGRKTWSVPIWTGKEPYLTHHDDLIPLEKEGFSAVEEETGREVSALLCDDPYREVSFEKGICSVVIDMKEIRSISGLGNYSRVLLGKKAKDAGLETEEYLAQLPFHYVISTSLDGSVFEQKAEGVFRSVGTEEVIRFEDHRARYLRLKILSTVGWNSHRKGLMNAPVVLSELTPFRKIQRSEMREYFSAILNQQ